MSKNHVDWCPAHSGAWNDGGAPRALHWLRESDGLYDAWPCCIALTNRINAAQESPGNIWLCVLYCFGTSLYHRLRFYWSRFMKHFSGLRGPWSTKMPTGRAANSLRSSRWTRCGHGAKLLKVRGEDSQLFDCPVGGGARTSRRVMGGCS